MIVKYFTIVAGCVGVLGIFGGLILPDPAHAALAAEAPTTSSVSSAPTGAPRSTLWRADSPATRSSRGRSRRSGR